ncbi:MAG: tyrosine-type recombinase/integrase [Planctomycetota bacterium]|jgi:integrase/recombinase XerD
MSKGKITGINWILTPDKFLSPEEARKLLETARERAEAARVKMHKTPVRDYFIVDLALSTGLRVIEIATLNYGDMFVKDTICSLLVRNGKGGKRRLVRFSRSFSHHCAEYMQWKQTVGEPTGPSDPLLLSSITDSHMTTRAVQKVFKRVAARAGLPSNYSIHALRHTYTGNTLDSISFT